MYEFIATSGENEIIHASRSAHKDALKALQDCHRVLLNTPNIRQVIDHCENGVLTSFVAINREHQCTLYWLREVEAVEA